MTLITDIFAIRHFIDDPSIGIIVGGVDSVRFQRLADPVTIGKLAKEFSLNCVDPAQAALLSLAWLAKIEANTNGK